MSLTTSSEHNGLYGSKAEPKKLFGEDTLELKAFYEAMNIMAPGPCELLIDLLNSWQSDALYHEWILPDGYNARVKVMVKHQHRIEVDELDHSTFTYEWYENAPKAEDRKNAANVVHSIDAYVLRSLLRRCNYDPAMLVDARNVLTIRQLDSSTEEVDPSMYPEILYYQGHYERSQMIDVTILPMLTVEGAKLLSKQHIQALSRVVSEMEVHEPFEVITVHDDFKCHVNHMTQLRKHYRSIMADLAESRLIEDILNQLHNSCGTFRKRSHDLAPLIRESEYALC